MMPEQTKKVPEQDEKDTSSFEQQTARNGDTTARTGSDTTGGDTTGGDTTGGDTTGGDTTGGDTTARTADDTTDYEQRERLVPEDRAASYGSRWDAVKGTFVDEPREAVAQADALVGELLDELEALFREQRRSIEQGLDNDETSTEELRLALRRYRSFFDRLLAI
jgi:hypothetical protein